MLFPTLDPKDLAGLKRAYGNRLAESIRLNREDDLSADQIFMDRGASQDKFPRKLSDLKPRNS
jgi:hypothetical protein